MKGKREYRKHCRDPSNTTKLRSFQCTRATTWPSGRLGTPNGKTVLVSYTILNQILKNRKVQIIAAGQTKQDTDWTH